MTAQSEVTDQALVAVAEAIRAERAAETSEDVEQNAQLAYLQAALDTANAEAAADDVADAEREATITSLKKQVASLKDQIAQTAKVTAIGASQPLNNLFGNTAGGVRIFLQDSNDANQLSPTNLQSIPQGGTVVVSRKDRGTWFAPALKSLKSARPDLKVYGTVSHHEPENDTTPDIYTQECREDAVALRAAGIPSVQILMGGSCNNGTWQQWVELSVDQLWWDVYHGGAGKQPKQYRAPADWLAVYFAANKTISKPIGFAEFGSRPTVTDNENYSSPAYLQWVKENAAYCRSHPDLLAALWFNFGAARIRFQNEPMATAWLKA